MLPSATKAISFDDHIIEPPNLWQDRLPAPYRQAGPHVVELDDGTQAWAYEDQLIRTVRGNTRTRPEFDDDPLGVARFDEMRPGCYDPKARLDDMDLDGVWAQVNFPDFCRFAGHRFLSGQDKVLSTLCIKAYNDFVLDEWCATNPERLIPLAVLPIWNVAESVEEVRRVAERGARAIAFSENPTLLELPSVYTDHWEPLWNAVADAGLVVCLHIGSGSKLLKSAEDAPVCSVLPYIGANSMMACTDWLFSGVLDRHPSIQIAFSEGGAGWLPYVLEQAEDVFARLRVQLQAKRPPRETFAAQMTVCILRDDTAINAIGVIPEDNITWESDYPHESTLFPHSRGLLEQSMAEVPDAVAIKFAETNARRLFRI
jgi:predicted TIM-barrel fold metal-dependent hydrolase